MKGCKFADDDDVICTNLTSIGSLCRPCRVAETKLNAAAHLQTFP